MYKGLLKWMEGHKDVVVDGSDPWEHIVAKFFGYLGYENASVMDGSMIHSRGTITQFEGQMLAFCLWYEDNFLGSCYITGACTGILLPGF